MQTARHPGAYLYFSVASRSTPIGRGRWTRTHTTAPTADGTWQAARSTTTY